MGAYFGRPAAGKTGTTDNHADAWFSGYVPQLQATVWVGYPQGEIPMTNVHGISVQGGSFPADDLAPVHGGRGSEQGGARLAAAAQPGCVAAVDQGPVRVELRAPAAQLLQPADIDLDPDDDGQGAASAAGRASSAAGRAPTAASDPAPASSARAAALPAAGSLAR